MQLFIRGGPENEKFIFNLTNESIRAIELLFSVGTDWGGRGSSISTVLNNFSDEKWYSAVCSLC